MSEHKPSLTPYILVFVALLLLTGVTIAIAYAPIGDLHGPAALAVAIVKATLVVLFFMHALHSARMTYVIIAASLLMLFVLFSLTWADYALRSI